MHSNWKTAKRSKHPHLTLIVCALLFVLSALGTGHAGDDGWNTLAEKKISKRVKTTVLAPDKDQKGGFQNIKLRVLIAPVKIYSITIVFSDGRDVEHKLNETIKARQETEEIELPTSAGPIKKVKVRYYAFHSAKIVLLGRPLP